MSVDYGVVFCGGGPAALGPFLRAAATDRLGELLARGVLVAERGARIGGGSLRHYRIGSNSAGGAFVEGLDAIPPGGPFDPARTSAAASELRRWGTSTVPLKSAGALLDGLGAAVRTLIDAHPGCAVACRTSVRRIQMNRDGTLSITLVREGVAHVVTAERAVIAMGGRPPARMGQIEVVPGMSLAQYAGKLRHASSLIDERFDRTKTPIDRPARASTVAVIGGSHSAWSSAWVLSNSRRFRSADGEPPRITLLHRGRTRLFYITAAAAHDEGYVFDPVRDVCPLSGRVHRAGGLKGDARELARAVLRGGDEASRIRLVRLDDAVDRDEIRRVLEEADLVVVATGYTATVPRLVREGHADTPLALSSSPAGLTVTDGAELVTEDGRVLRQLLAYGLGVFVRAAARVGGEPSHERAITSAWLYQHDVGEIVLQSLLAPNSGSGHGGVALAACAAVGS